MLLPPLGPNDKPLPTRVAFVAWADQVGIGYTLDIEVDAGWAAASWKEVGARQQFCEYIRTIDGLRAEITALNSTITSITEL